MFLISPTFKINLNYLTYIGYVNYIVILTNIYSEFQYMIHESSFFAPDKNINSSKGENLRIEQKK